MKSKAVSVYDYHKIDLSEFCIHFSPDEERIQDEMNRLANRLAVWEKSDSIEPGGVAVLWSDSDYAKYRKSKLNVAVGSGLFDAEFETQLIGLKIGEAREISTSKGSASVRVIDFMKKVVPAISDELIDTEGPEDVHTVAEFREKLIQEQKAEALDEVRWQADQKLYAVMHKNSEYVITKEDFQHCIQIQLDRMQAISDLQGLNLKTMTKEQYAGRIPVESYDQLLVLLYRDTWNYLENYLTGLYFAEQEGIQVDISEEAYLADIKEYAEFWKDSLDDAAKIWSREEFAMNQYKQVYYQKLSAYRDAEILKED